MAGFSNNGKVPREIERKFLVKRLPPNLRHYHSRTIEQGYLAAKIVSGFPLILT